MSILRELISEMADGGATGADAVASVPAPLFTKKKGLKSFSKTPKKPRLSESIGINSDETKFNAADVISKLDAAEKKAVVNDDTTTFGLKDETGNIVQVHVRTDQAQEFEKTLAAMLGGLDDDSDEKNTSMEIAEVLFDLRNKFDIIDIDWGTVETDEEEEQQVEGGDEMGMEGDPNAMDPNDPNAVGGEEMAPPDESGDVKSALSQVIDLLKSQAEAATAEAKAREAEAKAKEADAVARSSEAKIKQEEETLDMEAYYKKKADEKKESQRLAKLAKYKHDVAKEAGNALGGAELEGNSVSLEQEESKVVSPRELAATIFRQLQGG